MGRLILGLAVWLAGAAAVQAECVGRNLFDDLSPEVRTQIEAEAASTPYAYGTMHEATKGTAKLLLVGTYHFTDPRHAETIARLAPRIAAADALLVEAGPEEEAQLKQRLASDPTLMVDPHGPTLPERLGTREWAVLSAAMAERGIPAVIASRLRPWYVAVTLGVSPCILEQLQAGGGDVAGMDHLLIAEAERAGVRVAALEPYDTVFALFEDMSPDEELDMIRSALPGAERADDFTTTTAEAFFDGRVWELWEFSRHDAYENSGLTRAEVDRQAELAQERLMDQRNRSWMAPLTEAAEAAAARGKEVVAAFGALHLPGENGVLRLLERDGWTIERVTP